MTYYLDRIEGNYCVFICNGISFNIPRELVPEPFEGNKYLLIKSNETENIERNKELVDKLFK